jgi:hypothetical protein
VATRIGKSAALVSIAAAMSACSTFEGLSLERLHAEACKLAQVVPAPEVFDNAVLGHTFEVAVRRFDFSRGDGSVGFDLDGTCTGQGQGPSCQPPKWAVNHDDDPGGRDNVMSELFEMDDGGMVNNQANAVIEDGFLTTVLRIRNYDGLPSDGSVDVDLFAATRASGDRNTDPNPPIWDGSAVWNPLVEWTVPNGDEGTAEVVAQYRSDRAYVSDHVLYAHFKDALGANLLFSEEIFQARIEKLSPTSWTLRDGVGAGRLSIDQALGFLQFSADQATGMPMCTDSPSYSAMKKRVCALADIRATDNDSSAPCDGASWAWRFDTGPMILSNDVNPVLRSAFTQCPPETSPAFDSCASLDGAPSQSND